MVVKKEDREQGLTAAASRVEWAASLGAFAVILGLVGFLLFEAVTRSPSPAVLRTAVLGVEARGPQTEVEILIENRGGRGADAVSVEGRSTVGAAIRMATLDHAPPHSRRTVVLVFEAPVDPREFEVSIVSYTVS